mgnify:CR=1 FL=1|jgi:hypothetical protein
MGDIKYQAGGSEYLYPAAGDPKPPGGHKVQLLTIGGIHTTGPWVDDGFYVAWLPLPKRNRAKEALIEEQRGLSF